MSWPHACSACCLRLWPCSTSSTAFAPRWRDDDPLSNKKRITFAPRPPANHLHLQVGKRESLNRPRGDSHSRDALPVGSESHDYLRYFIVQCVSDIQLSNLSAGLQPAHLRLAIGQSERRPRRLQHAGIVTRSSGQWAFRAGAPADRPGSAIGRSERCATGAGLVATAATGARPSPPSWRRWHFRHVGSLASTEQRKYERSQQQ